MLVEPHMRMPGCIFQTLCRYVGSAKRRKGIQIWPMPTLTWRNMRHGRLVAYLAFRVWPRFGRQLHQSAGGSTLFPWKINWAKLGAGHGSAEEICKTAQTQSCASQADESELELVRLPRAEVQGLWHIRGFGVAATWVQCPSSHSRWPRATIEVRSDDYSGMVHGFFDANVGTQWHAPVRDATATKDHSGQYIHELLHDAGSEGNRRWKETMACSPENSHPTSLHTGRPRVEVKPPL